MASTVDEEPHLAEFFAEEKRIVALCTQWGELVVTAAYEDGWIYVRGENFDSDWYGSGRSVAAAVRDYLERVEYEVALFNKRRPTRD